MSQTAVICSFRIQCYAMGLQHFNKVTDLCGRGLNTCTHSTVQKSSATPCFFIVSLYFVCCFVFLFHSFPVYVPDLFHRNVFMFVKPLKFDINYLRIKSTTVVSAHNRQLSIEQI